MKTAYKDLRSKLREKTPPHGVGNSSSVESSSSSQHMSRSQYYDDCDSGVGGSHHHSAPNSPVFTKKQSDSTKPIKPIRHDSYQHQSLATASHKPTKQMLQTSSSMINHHHHHQQQQRQANFTNYNNNNNNNNHISHKSPSSPMSPPSPPTVSPPSSNSSSEMNLLQELQQHALFKTPVVNRSVSLMTNNRCIIFFFSYSHTWFRLFFCFHFA